MPVYNSEEYVARSVASVLAQTNADWELLISDDGSSDATPRIVEELVHQDYRIRVVGGHINQGAAYARNRAISVASGRYISFLDSDDLWRPEKLELQLAFMQEKDVAFSFSSYDRIDEDGGYINTHRVDRPVAYHDLLKSCVIGCLTAIYDTEKLGKVYMPDIRKRQDFALWLKILKTVDYAYPITDSLAQYRVRSGSISSNKASAARNTWKVYREVEKLSLPKSAYYFSHYALRGVANTYLAPKLSRLRGH